MQATAGDCPEPAFDDDVSMLSGGGTAGGGGGGAEGGADSLHPSQHQHHIPTGDPAALAVARSKRDSWRQLRGMRRRDAMRAFVALMDQCLPGWDSVS